ncbi:MAG: phosphatidylglycerophosphatase A [FCB group bacterium]|nr:phosphatidylglycerophosphatase A [FCB group bacterium]
MKFRWFDALSTVGYVGRLPIAPGTWGSLAALIVWYLIRPYTPEMYILIITGLLFLLGIIVSEKTERLLEVKDPGMIVIDEWVGQWIACWFLPRAIFPALGAFIFFRLFDIWKPWPVRKFDRLSGGWGIMLDDVAAGFLALLCIQLILGIVV